MRIPATTLCRSAAAALVVVVAAACSSMRPRAQGAEPEPGAHPARYLTARDIELSGARNAWEALRRLGSVRLEETPAGRPVGLAATRGRGSILLDDSPVVILDGVRLLEVTVLRSVPAGTIASIAFLNAADATLLHGSGTPGGAIVIVTRGRLDD